VQALDADSSARNMQLANRFQEIDDVIGDDVTLSLVWSRDGEASNGDYATISSSKQCSQALPSFVF